MAITYTWEIRQTNKTTVYGIPDVISHVHFNYVGTAEDGRIAKCQGTAPFQLVPYTYKDPATGADVTVPAAFNKDNYIPYDQITDAVLVDWLDASVPQGAIDTFQSIISQQLAE